MDSLKIINQDLCNMDSSEFNSWDDLNDTVAVEEFNIDALSAEERTKITAEYMLWSRRSRRENMRLRQIIE